MFPPVPSIHPSDQLEADLHFSSLEPSFQYCVAYYVLAECGAIEAPFTFRSSKVTDIGTLGAEISRMLDRLPNANDNDEQDGG